MELQSTTDPFDSNLPHGMVMIHLFVLQSFLFLRIVCCILGPAE